MNTENKENQRMSKEEEQKYAEDMWRHFFFGTFCIGAAALLTIITLIKIVLEIY